MEVLEITTIERKNRVQLKGIKPEIVKPLFSKGKLNGIYLARFKVLMGKKTIFYKEIVYKERNNEINKDKEVLYRIRRDSAIPKRSKFIIKEVELLSYVGQGIVE